MAQETDEQKKQREKRKREEELLGLLLLLLRGQFEHHTEDLTIDTVGIWQSHVLASLLPAHTQAAVLGRQRAGSTGPQDPFDTQFAQGVVDTQVPFLDKFAQAIKDGDSRYVDADGNILIDAVNARLQKYMERVVGTANEAFVLASPAGSTFDWRLMMGANHCTDCPLLAAGSPYTMQTLPSVPGDGSTECNVLCLCEIIRHDGVIGFTRSVLP